MKLTKHGGQLIVRIGFKKYPVKYERGAIRGKDFLGYLSHGDQALQYMIGANIAPNSFLGNHRSVREHRFSEQEKNILNPCQ